jgi:uncharacterized protein (TIGR02646 family)
MRYIVKSNPPTELTEWQNSFKATDIEPSYDELPGKIRESIIASLVREQQGICAYTGRRITIENSHIEHILPQSHYKQKTLDYRNMTACYPAPNTGTCPYGAHAKENWPAPNEESLFVSPLQQSCGSRFRYSYNGKIQGNATDESAKMTVEKLKLNHEELVRDRKSAIRRTLAPNNQMISPQKRKHLIAKWVQKEDSGEILEEFHFAVLHQLRQG